MKTRLIKTLFVYLIIVIAGLVYWLILSNTQFGFQCIFHLVTGLQCPGCGITRMIMAMFAGNWAEAFLQNQLLFLTWPFVIALVVYLGWRYIKYGNVCMPHTMNVICIGYAVLAIIFCIWRNLSL